MEPANVVSCISYIGYAVKNYAGEYLYSILMLNKNYMSVTGNCIFYSYNSDVAEYAEDGNGSVAHTWNCTECGNGGW